MAIKEAIARERNGGPATLRHPITRQDGGATDGSAPGALINVPPDEQVILESVKIDSLAYQSSFHPDDCRGSIPANTTLFQREDFGQAVKSMRRAFRAGFCVSQLVAVAGEGKRLGGAVIPRGYIGLMTLSQIAVKGVLLKSGIPVDTKFGGLIQLRNFEPLRFIDLIEYSSISLNPAEVFITAKMTSVNEAIKSGNGKILAGFWEIPASARLKVEMVIEKLKRQGIRGLLKLGKEGESICQTPVRLGRAGMLVIDGLNPIAAAAEAGVAMIHHHATGLVRLGKLQSFQGLSGKLGGGVPC